MSMAGTFSPKEQGTLSSREHLFSKIGHYTWVIPKRQIWLPDETLEIEMQCEYP